MRVVVSFVIQTSTFTAIPAKTMITQTVETMVYHALQTLSNTVPLSIVQQASAPPLPVELSINPMAESAVLQDWSEKNLSSTAHPIVITIVQMVTQTAREDVKI